MNGGTLEADEMERVRDEVGPPVAHIARRENERVALCGVGILGVPAFGEYVKCDACHKLWLRVRPLCLERGMV